MPQNTLHFCTQVKILGFLLVNLSLSWFDRNGVIAQVIPDSTLGRESSKIRSIDSTTDRIDGGAIRGSNLFHSFQEFNINTGQSVYFNNPVGIQNILGRVTGQNPSRILGTLGVLRGNANFFLLNPNGIIFGQNASLDVGGSFVASTANSIVFQDGSQFLANPALSQPLLTINMPIGLQFNDNNGQIINQSKANQTGLQVLPNKTLALVGSGITFAGGSIDVEGSRIELASVGKNSLVKLNSLEENLVLNCQDCANFQDIRVKGKKDSNSQLESISIISVISKNSSSGSIQILAKNIFVDDSQISIVSEDSTRSGNLTLQALERLELGGQFSVLVNSTAASGNAGKVVINTSQLIVNPSSIIFAAALADSLQNITGKAGAIEINASEFLEVLGSISTVNSTPENSGNAGNIDLKTDRLTVRDGGSISVQNAVGGDAGNIKIEANSVFLDTGGSISATATGGEGGTIELKLGKLLKFGQQSTISSSAGIENQGGNGGNIKIDSPLIVTFLQNNSDITANAFTGSGGNIQIKTKGIFGFQEGMTLNNLSNITASSKFSQDGIVNIAPSEFLADPSISKLPQDVLDASQQIDRTICSVAKGSSFIVTGRGGMVISPNDDLKDASIWEDWRIDISHQSSEEAVFRGNPQSLYAPFISHQLDSTQKPVNAQGWIINDRGNVVLTASPSNNSIAVPWLQSPTCQQVKLLDFSQ